MMLKKSASGVLASLRGSEALEGIFRSPSSILRANGHTKCGWYLLRLFAHCGLAWDKARLGAPGLGGFEKSGLFEHPAGDPALSTYLLPVDLTAQKLSFPADC